MLQQLSLANLYGRLWRADDNNVKNLSWIHIHYTTRGFVLVVCFKGFEGIDKYDAFRIDCDLEGLFR